MALALKASQQGREVDVFDEAPSPGGSTLSLNAKENAHLRSILTRFQERVTSGEIRLHSRSFVAGVFAREFLVANEHGVNLFEAKLAVIATGGHDTNLAFEGNDLPGIFSARAAGRLLGRGVVLGRRILVASVDGGTVYGADYIQAMREIVPAVHLHVHDGPPSRVRGVSYVRSAVLGVPNEHVSIDVDAVVIDAPLTPAYELAAQWGVSIEHDGHGFRPKSTKPFPNQWANDVRGLGEAAGENLRLDTIMTSVSDLLS
jgi:sarcosine oxidase subunit alpha